ncbi:MAG: indole-3-glycerol phosphate synthase TrpC [Desulfocapsaceae bacterium]|nr:indole-3-glycerol phosphate synthase TrpC [Desulfocapsaceae bacterium]
MILDTIVARKRDEVALLRKNGMQLPDEFAEREIAPPRGFRKALLDFEGVAIIAEAKKASPSKGVLAADFDIKKITRHYEKNGAQAVSVLTDVDFFQGSMLNLLKAREIVSLPVLRKDFIIDELQIQEAAIHGADAVLLITGILDEVQLGDYYKYARELQMDVLVEVHDEQELEKALRADCNLIGINNRNLKDFSMDIGTTFRLKNNIPNTIPVVSESGIKNGEDIKKLNEHGVTAALIGETLMRAGSDAGVFAQLRLHH